jgi:hypothetical protein
MLAGRQYLDRLEADIGGEKEELHRDELLCPLLGRVGKDGLPVKRQMMMRLATPSIAESSPKPTSAIEETAIPAVIAIAPSTVIQPSESQESRRTRRASCS